MSGFDVQSGELFAARTMVAEAAADGRAELGRLRAAAQDLLGHGWRGQAAAAFGEGWAEWSEGAALVLGALDEMARALGVTAAGYEQDEQSTVSSLQRIAS